MSVIKSTNFVSSASLMMFESYTMVRKVGKRDREREPGPHWYE